jgi:hypothetical protein
MSLRLRPWTVKRETALAFNLEVHRKLKKIQGAMWCVSIREGAEIVGVALVGWPSQEQTSDEIDHLRVLRCTVKEGHKNGCSMLYGACWRAARAMGVESMDTFTHLDEPGTSLRAAGWIEDGLTSGGEHSRASRPRKPQEDARPKRRWWAPGSAKLPNNVGRAS